MHTGHKRWMLQILQDYANHGDHSLYDIIVNALTLFNSKNITKSHWIFNKKNCQQIIEYLYGGFECFEGNKWREEKKSEEDAMMTIKKDFIQWTA